MTSPLENLFFCRRSLPCRERQSWRACEGATLIGNGPDAMSKISMIGNDTQLDSGIGTCGKAGQSVPVGVGQPTVKMGGITVGGTEAA